jgi:hypothetical protein
LFQHSWLSSCLEVLQLRDPAMASFNGRSHGEVVAEFQQLDKERLAVAVARVRRAHAQRAIDIRNRYADQNTLVAREAQKKARHIPLRQLVTQAPDVLLALRPCWMASPLSVSQLIPGNKTYFDVVIFDEASQVLPEDAVTSLLRGARAVVAGDRRQLPPTTFFAAGEDEEGADEDNATGGFESILDVMSAFLDPPWSLFQPSNLRRSTDHVPGSGSHHGNPARARAARSRRRHPGTELRARGSARRGSHH